MDIDISKRPSASNLKIDMTMGNLTVTGSDNDKGSLYDRNLSLITSPLDIIYDTKTTFALLDVFRSPEEIIVDYLQEAAMDGIKEYKDVNMSQLG